MSEGNGGFEKRSRMIQRVLMHEEIIRGSGTRTCAKQDIIDRGSDSETLRHVAAAGIATTIHSDGI